MIYSSYIEEKEDSSYSLETFLWMARPCLSLALAPSSLLPRSGFGLAPHAGREGRLMTCLRYLEYPSDTADALRGSLRAASYRASYTCERGGRQGEEG
jgi:hypothetical protein